MALKLVNYQKENVKTLHSEYHGIDAYEHHQCLIDDYVQTHYIRNHSENTIQNEKRFLEGWFESHGNDIRPLYTWEAMEPLLGRKRIQQYGKVLLDSGITNHSIRRYLGILRRYFSYILEHPYVEIDKTIKRINLIYNQIEQPVSNYDIPQHSYSGDKKGLSLDPQNLYNYYQAIQTHYLSKKQTPIRARNYAMAVLAGESGLRCNELLNLEISKDLFFDSMKLQTRHAKGTKGSGKRARQTLFTSFARDTIQFYIKSYRNKIIGAKNTDFLFISQRGNRMSQSTANTALLLMIKAIKKAEFPIGDNMSWHEHRRIFATKFIENNPQKLPILITLLGHMSSNTVSHYIKHSEAWIDSKIVEVIKGN